MKRFSTKMAARVLLAITALDVVLLVLTQALPDTSATNWLLGIPWWAINFPGFPLVRFLHGPGFAVAFVAVPLLSALIWSAIAGYVLRQRDVS
jgi:hypothetical protein